MFYSILPLSLAAINHSRHSFDRIPAVLLGVAFTIQWGVSVWFVFLALLLDITTCLFGLVRSSKRLYLLVLALLFMGLVPRNLCIFKLADSLPL
jgi:lipoprotein signal peptidase